MLYELTNQAMELYEMLQEEEIDENFEKAQALIKEAWQYKNFNKKKNIQKAGLYKIKK